MFILNICTYIHIHTYPNVFRYSMVQGALQERNLEFGQQSSQYYVALPHRAVPWCFFASYCELFCNLNIKTIL